MNVEEHGSGSVAGVGDMELPAGQFPKQPAVHGPKGQPSGLSELARTWHLIEDPGDFAGGKIGINQQAGSLLNQGFMPRRLELVAKAGGATVLPNHRVVNRLPGFAVPHHGGLSLIGDSNRRNVPRPRLGAAQDLDRHGDLGCPDFFRIVLDPSRARKNLFKFTLRHGLDRTFVIEKDRP
jgi:hypothetical protein